MMSFKRSSEAAVTLPEASVVSVPAPKLEKRTVPVVESCAVGVVVPIPTFPLPCCNTNCEEPMVKPWPLAIVVVPLVEENAPRGEVSVVPSKVSAVPEVMRVPSK